jgi:hypothetical protein
MEQQNKEPQNDEVMTSIFCGLAKNGERIKPQRSPRAQRKNQ